MTSLRDRILAAKRPTRTVHVDEWGVDVGIRELSLIERLALLQHVADNERAVEAYTTDQALPESERKGVALAKPQDHQQLMLMAAMVDPETGEVIFSLSEYDAFQSRGYVRIQKLLRVFLDLNVYRDEQTSSDLKKTSDQTTSDGSPSA